jgi:hypothetical protein
MRARLAFAIFTASGGVLTLVALPTGVKVPVWLAGVAAAALLQPLLFLTDRRVRKLAAAVPNPILIGRSTDRSG